MKKSSRAEQMRGKKDASNRRESWFHFRGDARNEETFCLDSERGRCLETRGAVGIGKRIKIVDTHWREQKSSPERSLGLTQISTGARATRVVSARCITRSFSFRFARFLFTAPLNENFAREIASRASHSKNRISCLADYRITVFTRSGRARC